MSRGGSTASNGFFSSISSLFNAPTSSTPNLNGHSTGKRNTFGSGLPSSTRRGPSDINSDEAAWSLPYSYQSRQSNKSSLQPLQGQYPPSRENSIAFESSTTVNMTGQPFHSTATLVPAQGRPSLSLNSNVSFPSTAYPPLKPTWKRIRNWCESHYSELGDTLNWPASEMQIEDLEMTIGYTLPAAVRDSYLCYDGQELESNNSCSDGLFFGLPLLSLEQIAEEWRFWRSVDDDAATGANAEVKGWMSSCPAGWIRSEYSCRGWIPLITDRVGNYIGIDLNPKPQGGGSPGQVILFGRDFDTKIVLWRGEGEGGWGRFLQYVAEELEGGESWTLEDNQSTDSNDEEDAIGYESYFSNGGAGASRGGGDRGGDGAIGFKLRGEYKGWPVLEAWADRSMRCWEEVGLSTGQPPWQKHPPSVLINEETGSEVIGGNAEASGSTPRIVSTTIEGQNHPLDANSTTETSLQSTADSVPPSSTLSPPLPSSRAERSKQKRRDDSRWQHPRDGLTSPTSNQGPSRKVITPPAPAGPLDLPTIDDVRAIHAATMASQQKGGNYHYDVERARPPPGMGGSGMGMGMASTTSKSTYKTRYAARQSSANKESASRNGSRENDGLELKNRSSVETARNSTYSNQQEANTVDYLRSSPHPSPRMSASDGRISTSRDKGRSLYSPTSATSVSSSVDGRLGTLIDATSSIDLSRPSIDDNIISTTTEPLITSPLASQAPIYPERQELSANDNVVIAPTITSQ